ncbi:glyoxalase/bleomycin resistance protein/dioxygenase superfamily protein [Algoriphagus boseongensis]|uniref:Glyoxalase/bleomycin resistance protein/dioxygenase superfamily protein n=1 Tax=Algoriphagus boseongensis TaxID=1442587 RepID=A0A4R6T411_9BACT|nr:VOC family protein [Algoriphagus boseongensis]TDQ14597.1 glyoxalase/bleomycin resistance protein/dioxygenase superfamily protein [Algoriphagus boseongensis]
MRVIHLIHISRRLSYLLILASLLAFSCQKREFLKESGQLESFAEMVQAGVKPIAFGPAMTEAEASLFKAEAERIAGKYGLEILLETDFPETDLFPLTATQEKQFYILGNSNSLLAYQSWKEEVEGLISSQTYTKDIRRSLSRRLGRLLGYPTDHMNDLLGENSAFRDVEDFGIQGSSVHWYYRDFPKAKNFYSEKLGLNIASETDSSATFQLAGDSYLVLHALKGSGFSGSEPKSVALALLSDHLQGWYQHLLEQNVTIKYPLKVKPGGPHDGFVAVDPEGYLLEFEAFYQHPENEILISELQNLSPTATSLGKEFSFKATVVWLYYQDMLSAENFIQESMGLTKSADQGWAKIYKASENGFIGLVDGLRGMNTYSPEKLVKIGLDLENPGPWENYLKANSTDSLRQARTFRDAGGYIFTF